MVATLRTFKIKNQILRFFLDIKINELCWDEIVEKLFQILASLALSQENEFHHMKE